MTEASVILNQIDQGDPSAADALLPLVYDELRRLASHRMSQEHPGQTLSPTALVHEAYLRLVDTQHPQAWQHRRHFVAAAAEAMRRILVERARRKRRVRHGRDWKRVELDPDLSSGAGPATDLEALDESLNRLESHDPRKAQLVKLRYFAGFTISEAAEILNVSAATAERDWAYARVWLLRDLKQAGERVAEAETDT